ncbi:MAG: hypothetical protein KBC96_03885 [Armatimonadetes bacterium]|nr:hypothetical protein [Armatimonadota bacterium]
MEKSISFTHEEATALLEMSLCASGPGSSEAADSALRKLGDLCRQFALDEDSRGLCPLRAAP